ncbi:hypothetical protein RJT34_08895 [Clitoria ternatea]|uniref:Factor of DNA methylation 1-5/IDN2 domain-containing protein n=1 Tax=Clitoria ternatea TaxID=43366 RepID=A0AAN9PUC7_CLITE
MLEEKDKLHSAFVEESRNMQRRARNEVRRILDEQEKLSSELEAKRRKLDSWSRDLNKREVLTDQETQKLEEEKKKKDLRNESLRLASKEQKIADENVLRLVEEQKGLEELLSSSRTNIGLKRMGELDQKIFVNQSKKRFPLEEAGTKGVELCSLWQENVKNSAWHPFKGCKVEDKEEMRKMRSYEALSRNGERRYIQLSSHLSARDHRQKAIGHGMSGSFLDKVREVAKHFLHFQRRKSRSMPELIMNLKGMGMTD